MVWFFVRNHKHCNYNIYILYMSQSSILCIYIVSPNTNSYLIPRDQVIPARGYNTVNVEITPLANTDRPQGVPCTAYALGCMSLHPQVLHSESWNNCHIVYKLSLIKYILKSVGEFDTFISTQLLHLV